MGWESFHSIWDEPVDPPAGDQTASGKQQSTKGKSWWDEFHDDDLTRDGTSSAGSYSYKEAFDDSDLSWYRKSSFKYSGYSDYSPSSLFRSSFVGFRYTGAGYNGENEAKNKAVRALRTLTRNANTLVDAAKKISYDVQFSSGVDSNGVGAGLTVGKKQTIFVSPDKLVETKTTDDEDAVIDALTGFVLLRVQISQSIPAPVITEINSVSINALPAVLASSIQKLISGATTGDASSLAADFMDSYLSGMLAKSMLTRLCRRKVVEDWGGFAPYFVRHAKQFAETREKIEGTPPSVESWIAKMAYNMIADESAIEIAEDISSIADKHLGAELEHDQIFVACKALIAELREYFKAKGEKCGGEVEDAVTAGLAELVQEQQELEKRSAAKEELMSASMEEFAKLMDELYASTPIGGAEKINIPPETLDKLIKVESAAHQLKYKEKLISALKDNAKQFERGVEAKFDEGQFQSTQFLVDNNLAHFNAQLLELIAAGADSSLLDSKRHSELPTLEKYSHKAEDLRAFAKGASSIIKDELKKLKEEAAKAIKAAMDKFPGIKANLEELRKKAAALRERLREAEMEHGCRGASHPADACSRAADTLTSKISTIQQIETALSGSSATRQTSGGLQMFCAHTRRTLDTGIDDCSNVINNMAWNTTDPATRNFMHEANTGQSDYIDRVQSGDETARIDEWHENAIRNFVSKKIMTERNFSATAMENANQDLFDAIRELLNKSDKSGGMPSSARNLEEERREPLEKLADSLGMSAQELLDMLHASENVRNNPTYDAADAQKLGEMVGNDFASLLKGLSAIDEQLFGQAVEKRTTVLDDVAVQHVNDEARNIAEEDYVAYLSHSEAKPKPWTKKTKSSSEYAKRARQIRNKHKAAIERIRNALCFQGTKRTGEVHGMLSGDLDEGGLHKLRYDSEHIWSQKQIVKLPDVAVGILVDQSGSMSGTKISQAREICILLAEAVKKIEGMHLHIYGHSANMRDCSDLVMFEHYSSCGSADTANLDALGAIEAHANNYDGYAIKEAAKMLERDPAKKKYLFVISDGLPHGTGYAGEDAQKHVTSVCSFVRNRLKIPTYAFAVGVAKYEQKNFENQYGKNHVVFLSDVQKCLPQLVRFLHNALQKEKSLVSVEAD